MRPGALLRGAWDELSRFLAFEILSPKPKPAFGGRDDKKLKIEEAESGMHNDVDSGLKMP